MAANTVTSDNVKGYSGILFNKGNTRTPFLSLLRGKQRYTDHVEFVTGLEFTTGGGAQPNISEAASLIAPTPSFVTRTQKTNYTQIFHESVAISYAKQSNMGTLHGINVAGQTANPANELDFQVAAKMAKIGQDIEFTFMQGAKQAPANDTTAAKTAGMFTAISSNEVTLTDTPLRVWDIAEAMQLIKESNGDVNELVLWLNATSLFQLSADAEANGLTVVPASRNINGIALSRILTPLGEINVYLGNYVPDGKAGIFNIDVVRSVEQITPGKGNFFTEPLAKTGAGEKHQLFGQIGLDHGPEWYHAVISGINETFTKPKAGRKIYAVDPLPTVEVFPELASVTLAGAVYNTATEALAYTYTGTPLEAPTLAWEWQIGNSALGPFEPISGQTSATYTPVLGDIDKFIKVKVTASVKAVGTVYSNAKKVKAIDVDVTSEIANATPGVINVSFGDIAVAGLDSSNFVVKKGEDELELDSVAPANANKGYDLTLKADAVFGEVYTVEVTEEGYKFVGTEVDNQVEE